MRSLTMLALVLLGTTIMAAQTPSRRDALAGMADAERAFARTALVKGIRDAFVEFFADEAIGFYPTPMKAREVYQKQPPTPLSRRLEWEPRTGDIAASGELGWLTGPFSMRNTETTNPPAYGCYFSIWKKQTDGTWRVLMDVGVPTPEVAAFPSAFAAVDEPGGRYRVSRVEVPEATLLDVDRRFAKAAASNAVPAYRDATSAVSRLHVPGRQPIVGATAISGWLGGQAPVTFTPEAGGVARSGELGFTRGAYTQPAAGGAEGEQGYYVRTWKRLADGRWTIGAEVRSPAPPPNAR